MPTRKNFSVRKEQRQEEVEARQVEHDALTTKQKIAKLDKKFGEGQGAKKERTKFQEQLDS